MTCPKCFGELFRDVESQRELARYGIIGARFYCAQSCTDMFVRQDAPRPDTPPDHYHRLVKRCRDCRRPFSARVKTRERCLSCGRRWNNAGSAARNARLARARRRITTGADRRKEAATTHDAGR